jgi:hypothetical protein
MPRRESDIRAPAALAGWVVMWTRRRARNVLIVGCLTLALLGDVGPRALAAGALNSGGWSTTGKAAPATVSPGAAVSLTVNVGSSSNKTALVDLEVYDSGGIRAFQKAWDTQTFKTGVTRGFSTSWTPPTSALGSFVVKIGVFRPGWAALDHWNNGAASFTVGSSDASTTTTSVPTRFAAPPTTTTAPPTKTPLPPASSNLPPLPAAWPPAFELGEADGPGGAAAMAQTAPYGFRYQYLAGGANTGNGWSTWNPDGGFATSYIEESRQAGIIPIFTYYQLFQSNPGAGMGEPAGLYANLDNADTMAAYFADLKLFFQKAGAAGGTTVLHVEPDLWAYLQQKATGDDGHTVEVKVGASGMAETAGLPDNAAGLAQAVVRLRDRYASNVLLAYHFSTWGTGNDIVYSDPSDSSVDALGTRTGRFEQSLGAPFDIAFTDLSDRDAAFKQYVYGDGGSSWYDANDYRRSTEYIAAFVRTARLRVTLWQVPLGNTMMRPENNTWDHYQDNKVEWLLDDATRAHLTAYANAGVVAVMYGRGADGATCACDANGDGVTNPAPVSGNDRMSLNADDDGGYFRDRAAAYYSAGRLGLPG